MKHLRWVSWILADGSQIRSLSGRTAKLGDGFSRNPGDRDQLLEQRTRDLQGRTGQLREFTLESFLSDYEEQGRPYPWTIADDAVPDGEPGIAVCGGAAGRALGLPAVHAAASVGVELTWRTLHVLGVVDSSDTGQRQQARQEHMRKVPPGIPSRVSDGGGTVSG